MADRIEPRVLKGFRDYLPDEMAPREAMLERISEVFRRFGFSPLATPCMELAEILLGKYGQDAEVLFYRFKDHGGRDVCLRYDLTVPLARVVAQYRDLPRPFKRYQIGPVWRGENTGRGRYREFYQCDVDIVGTTSLLADAECVEVANAVIEALGVERFEVRINNRKVLTGLGEQVGIAPGRRLDWVLRTIDKFDKVGEAGVRDLLGKGEEGTSEPLPAEAVEQIVSTLLHRDPGWTDDRLLDHLRERLAGSKTGLAGVDELAEVLRLVRAYGLPPDRVRVNLSIARGLDYYTGTVFETFLTDLPGLGSVMSGGRYDHLVGMFLGEDVPAVGISLGIDRLLAGLDELGKLGDRGRAPAVLVAVFRDERDAALAAAAALRRAGVDAELYLDADAALGKQIKYAERRGIPLLLIIGPDERKAGAAALKDLRARTQTTVPLDRLADEVRARAK